MLIALTVSAAMLLIEVPFNSFRMSPMSRRMLLSHFRSLMAKARRRITVAVETIAIKKFIL